MQNVINKNPNEEEFHQAVHEVAESVIPFILENPEYKKVLFRLISNLKKMVYITTI